MKKETSEKEIDILDGLKNREKIKKVKILNNSIEDIKKKMRLINETKEEINVFLKELVKEADIKRVIDFLNECDDVKLNDDDKERIKERVKNDIKYKHDKVVIQLEENIEKMTITSNGNIGIGTTAPCTTYNTNDNIWYTKASVTLNSTDNTRIDTKYYSTNASLNLVDIAK